MESGNKDIAIVLGGTNPHAELTRLLIQRGYYVILVDYAKNTPASKHANEHVLLSIFEKEKILELAKIRNAKLVISAAAERANAIACYVMEKLGYYAPYSYDTALEISNKISMKSEMKKFGIPTSNYVYTNSIKNRDVSSLKYPMVVKPVDGYGSKGVEKVFNENELNACLNKVHSSEISKSVIIEEYLEGREIGVYCFFDDCSSNIVFTNEKFKSNQFQEIPALGTISLPKLSEKVFKKIKIVIDKIRVSFNLKNTPFMAQLIVRDDEVKVIEFSPRLGGGLSFRTVKLQTDFDFLEASIDSFLGVKHKPVRKDKGFLVATSNIFTKRAVFDRLEGYEKFIENGIINEIFINKKKGMEVSKDFSSSSRLGQIILVGKDEEEIFKNTELVYNNIEAYDINNNPILLKGFYLKKE